MHQSSISFLCTDNMDENEWMGGVSLFFSTREGGKDIVHCIGAILIVQTTESHSLGKPKRLFASSCLLNSSPSTLPRKTPNNQVSQLVLLFANSSLHASDSLQKQIQLGIELRLRLYFQ